MEYRRLGTTDFTVSALCLGTMQFGWTADKETSLAILTAAYEAGINFVDTADIYSKWVAGNQGGEAETIIGEWLKQGSAEGSGREENRCLRRSESFSHPKFSNKSENPSLSYHNRNVRS